MKEDDNNWPEPDNVGRQELEIVMGNEHISFTTSKIGSLIDVQSSKDPEGLRIFYYLVQVSHRLQPVPPHHTCQQIDEKLFYFRLGFYVLVKALSCFWMEAGVIWVALLTSCSLSHWGIGVFLYFILWFLRKLLQALQEMRKIERNKITDLMCCELGA